MEELKSLNAEDLLSSILNALADKVNFKKCIAQAYHGALVVSEKHANMQEYMRSLKNMQLRWQIIYIVSTIGLIWFY